MENHESNKVKITPILLSGGSGTRLWPISRSKFPKQFIKGLIDKRSMFQETIHRLHAIEELDNPLVVCNKDHKDLVLRQFEGSGITPDKILLEPIGCNTALSIALAALSVDRAKQESSEQNLLLILPCDHAIKDVDNFKNSIRVAIKRSKNNELVTFGIKPSDPNTGYGYIEYEQSPKNYHRIIKFVEKPDEKLAKKFFDSDNYLWNSGMFMFSLDVLIDELKKHSWDVLNNAISVMNNSKFDEDFVFLNENYMEECENISIDKALMEKTCNSSVITLDAGWSDMGSWKSLSGNFKKDKDNNSVGENVIIKDTKNSFIYSEEKKIVSLGLDNVIIADSADVTLIMDKNSSHLLTDVISDLKESNDLILEENRKVYRPWGWYDSIERGDKFQVKRLHVYPKARLSLQSHEHRSEHWVVVKGTATITNGKDKFELIEKESTFIQQGAKHRLENNTDDELEIIEVQIGSYLGEDDIERYEDDHGREIAQLISEKEKL